MTRMTIIGIEAMEGIGKDSGKPYAMGRLHTAASLAPPAKDGWMSRGQMGTTYDCDPNLVRKLEKAPMPVTCEVVLEDVMRFGKREQIVVDVLPTETIKKSA